MLIDSILTSCGYQALLDIKSEMRCYFFSLDFNNMYLYYPVHLKVEEDLLLSCYDDTVRLIIHPTYNANACFAIRPVFIYS